VFINAELDERQWGIHEGLMKKLRTPRFSYWLMPLQPNYCLPSLVNGPGILAAAQQQQPQQRQRAACETSSMQQ
jgi:hypothetical protein